MSACEYIYKKYHYEFDSINEVYDIRDYMNKLYKEGGKNKILSEFFLPSATLEYIQDYMKLVEEN